ncbi:hypothetical protein SK224_07990 [Microbacterium sp. BG28]|uniref:hypothetical protein n=1 Tax=Microbacterium sp. BG28 TaxID=3097356 RepID=UPI002A5ADFC0|nr:hypothetical protein [Microbacterium sp. BG28]MDY0829067.1 hypothetical protein [Microbacterium sp. BG28]
MTTLPMVFPDDRPRARRSDPITSHQAADQTTRRGDAHHEVLSWLSLNPEGLTDDEIADKHIRSRRKKHQKPCSGSRLRTARSELVEDGLVEAIGEGSSVLGNPAQKWGLRVQRP